MKKFTALAFAVLLLMFVASCGSDKKTEEKLPDSEVTDEDAVDDEPADTTPDSGDTTPNEGDTTPDGGDTTPDEGNTTPDGGDATPDEGDSAHDGGDTAQDDADTNTNDDDADSGAVIDDADSSTNDDDADNVLPDEDSEQETGSCTYIPNAFVSNWTDNFPTDWVSKTKLSYEKIDRGEGNYALRASVSAQTKAGYAFEPPAFVPAEDAAFPTKLTFDLKTNNTSKISINLRCGDLGDKDGFQVYNWDSDSKTFAYAGTVEPNHTGSTPNKYNPVVLEGNINEFHEVTVVLGDELKQEGFWRGQKCRFEFKYGKEADFDVTIDNLVFHTAAGACEPDDDPAEEDDNDDNDTNDDDADSDTDDQDTDTNDDDTDTDTDDQDTDTNDDDTDTDTDDQDTDINDDDDDVLPDDEPEPQTCVQIPNGDFSGTWDEDGVPQGWTKDGSQLSKVTFAKDENGALRITRTNDGSTGYAAYSPKFIPAADAGVPAGIKFKMAVNSPSLVSINIGWKDEQDHVKYNPYNWDSNGQVFVSANQNQYFVNLGNTLTETYIIFGDEMTADFWHRGTPLTLQFKFGNKDKNTNVTYDYDISVKDFEFVYFGGDCNNVPARTIGYAHTQWPESIEGYAGMKETVYGRIYISGLTDQTVNKSVALLGVKAQLGTKSEEDADFVWEDNYAIVNPENESSGNDDEYKYEHTFNKAGKIKYKFRFTADNGLNWKEADNYWEATIFAPEPGQFGNADFSYWSNDTTPQVWTSTTEATISKWDRGDANGLAAKVTATKSLTKGDIFTSGEFVVPTGKIAKKITFDMATDQAIKPKIGVNCASTTWYGWDSTAEAGSETGLGYFTTSKDSFVSIDFGDNNKLHPTYIKLDSANTTGTCQLIVRYRADKDSWAAFDNFTVVYEDAE